MLSDLSQAGRFAVIRESLITRTVFPLTDETFPVTLGLDPIKYSVGDFGGDFGSPKLDTPKRDTEICTCCTCPANPLSGNL